jgi:hypothetical protein
MAPESRFAFVAPGCQLPDIVALWVEATATDPVCPIAIKGTPTRYTFSFGHPVLADYVPMMCSHNVFLVRFALWAGA